jgi:hypothetical protein
MMISLLKHCDKETFYVITCSVYLTLSDIYVGYLTTLSISRIYSVRLKDDR